MAPRRLAVLSTGRQDYGILRSTLRLLRDDPRFALSLWLGGMHLSARFGMTAALVEADGLHVAERLDFLGEPPDPVGDAARALTQVSAALSRHRPDVLVLVGDRSETLAAGMAAALAGVPLVHLHGGEETEGAVDNQLRHALTKLSHVHLVAHEAYARRVRQMGEADDAVHVVGPPGVDNLFRNDLPGRAELERFLGLELADPVGVVTVHPATLGGEPLADVRAVTAAMEVTPATWVITEPNADAGAEAIRAHLQAWAAGRPRVRLVKALGELRYFGLLRLAACVLGNSSSGVIEAPMVGVPVVNVGDRQKGRLRCAHVVDVSPDAEAVRRALADALRPETKARLAGAPPPFPRGAAAPRIVEVLARAPLPRPPRKTFVDRDIQPQGGLR
jgi:UDP-hydrolysing UDP-N-acetyl-D-glucosamine 2-epimerase